MPRLRISFHLDRRAPFPVVDFPDLGVQLLLASLDQGEQDSGIILLVDINGEQVMVLHAVAKQLLRLLDEGCPLDGDVQPLPVRSHAPGLQMPIHQDHDPYQAVEQQAEDVFPDADDQPEYRKHPDAGRGGEAEYLICGLDQRPCSQKADAGHDRAEQKQRILRIDVHCRYRQAAGADPHKDEGAEADGLMGTLPVQAKEVGESKGKDEPNEHDREFHKAERGWFYGSVSDQGRRTGSCTCGDAGRKYAGSTTAEAVHTFLPAVSLPNWRSIAATWNRSCT